MAMSARAIRTSDDLDARFAAAVRDGLMASPKRMASSWLYDSLGSALFDAICLLPWYRVTRAERGLLAQHADEITAACADVDFIAELGPGNGEKLATLVQAAAARGATPAVHLVDVSSAALEQAIRTLGRAGATDISTVRAEYLDGIASIGRCRRGRAAALVAFLGSNIGNFHWPEAIRLLAHIARALHAGDRVLLGADLVKPERELLLAYDDPLGVTAAFNRNLLVRINRELGASFDVQAFAHLASWNPTASRVDMHLVASRSQAVDIPGARCTALFDPEETIWTESSYKYDLPQLAAMGTGAGLAIDAQWVDPAARFALTLFRVSPEP
jgi:dimethylhistidine N-methyltransferase